MLEKCSALPAYGVLIRLLPFDPSLKYCKAVEAPTHYFKGHHVDTCITRVSLVAAAAAGNEQSSIFKTHQNASWLLLPE